LAKIVALRILDLVGASNPVALTPVGLEEGA
jgi:hypothetical protein